MFAIFIGEAEITPQYYGAYLMSARMGFLISTAIALIALVLVIAADKLKGKTSDRIESPIH